MFGFEQDVNKSSKMGDMRKFVTTFFVSYRNMGNDIKIDIYEHENGSYIGICEYSIWTPTQATPYKSLHPQENVKKALDDALSAFREYDTDEYTDDVVFLQDEKGNIFNANGEKKTYKQAITILNKISNKNAMMKK